MNFGAGPLGCSVAYLHNLGTPYIQKRNSGGYWGNSDYEFMKDAKNGFTNFLFFARAFGGGGVVLFADNSNFGNGARLAKYLADNGCEVQKTREYENPAHGGKCTVWAWYFRKDPDKEEVSDAVEMPKVVVARRSVSSARRTSMVAKAKTAVRRIASKRPRS